MTENKFIFEKLGYTRDNLSAITDFSRFKEYVELATDLSKIGAHQNGLEAVCEIGALYHYANQSNAENALSFIQANFGKLFEVAQQCFASPQRFFSLITSESDEVASDIALSWEFLSRQEKTQLIDGMVEHLLADVMAHNKSATVSFQFLLKRFKSSFDSAFFRHQHVIDRDRFWHHMHEAAADFMVAIMKRRNSFSSTWAQEISLEILRVMGGVNISYAEFARKADLDSQGKLELIENIITPVLDHLMTFGNMEQASHLAGGSGYLKVYVAANSRRVSSNSVKLIESSIEDLDLMDGVENLLMGKRVALVTEFAKRLDETSLWLIADHNHDFVENPYSCILRAEFNRRMEDDHVPSNSTIMDADYTGKIMAILPHLTTNQREVLSRSITPYSNELLSFMDRFKIRNGSSLQQICAERLVSISRRNDPKNHGFYPALEIALIHASTLPIDQLARANKNPEHQALLAKYSLLSSEQTPQKRKELDSSHPCWH